MRRAALLLIAAALPLAAGCGARGNRPGYAVLPGMVDSVPYDAYDPNPLTPAGQTLLAPPEGAVPVEWTPFTYGPGPDEARRAGAELVNPLKAGEAELARGKQVFATTCIVCHGAKGEGDGPIIGRFPNPPSLLAARARGLPDGQMYHIVTRGQGIMPSHAAQVLPDDRWRVVLYLRQLQGSSS